jgi:two-component system, NarL family, nitrate/nitrite response regulator NarL
VQILPVSNRVSGPAPRVEPITVLIADDHALFREAVRRLIDADPQLRVVGEAATGRDAIRLTAELKPDVLLIDLLMPVTPGIEVLREVARVSPHVRSLVLTASVGQGDVFEALRVGARGVLLKDSATHLLFKSIRVVMEGQYWVGRESVGGLIEKMRAGRGVTPPAANPASFGLTAREIEMVSAVVAGCSNSDIAAQFAISQKTVKHHLTNIFDKLGLSNRLELALFAVNHRFDAERSN